MAANSVMAHCMQNAIYMLKKVIKHQLASNSSVHNDFSRRCHATCRGQFV